MVLPRYLAMTREEFVSCHSLPEHLAWMACHFSPYGTGLTNLPSALPPGSMVILNDRIPLLGHDPDTVLKQLQVLKPDCLLLDFQHPPTAKSLEMTRRIIDNLPCPIGVPAVYGGNLNCPLFLPAPPPDKPLSEHLAAWKGREIWLEIGLNAMIYTVTGQGSSPGSLSVIPENGQYEVELCCHYRIDPAPEQAVFSLWRTRQDLDALLEKAQAYGVTKAVGLWQELH